MGRARKFQDSIVAVSLKLPSVLCGRVDSNRGDVSRTDWIIAAIRAKLDTPAQAAMVTDGWGGGPLPEEGSVVTVGRKLVELQGVYLENPPDGSGPRHTLQEWSAIHRQEVETLFPTNPTQEQKYRPPPEVVKWMRVIEPLQSRWDNGDREGVADDWSHIAREHGFKQNLAQWKILSNKSSMWARARELAGQA